MSRKYIQHLRSKQVNTIQEHGLDKDIPKVPQPKSEDAPEGLDEGEIAINFADGHEVLCIKNENGDIVKFLNENVIYENEEVTATALSEIYNQLAYIASGQPYVIQLLDNCDPDAHSANLYIAKDLKTGNEITNDDFIVALKAKRIILVVYHGGCFVPAFTTYSNEICTEDAFPIKDIGYYFVNIGDTVSHSTSDSTDPTFDGSLNRTIRVIRFCNGTWSMVDIDFYTKQEVDQKIADAGTFDPTSYYTISETNGLLEDKVDYLTFTSTQEMQNTINGVRLGTIGITDDEHKVYVLIYRNGNKEWYDVTTDNTGGGGEPIITHNTIETLTPTADLDRPIEVEVGDTYDEAFSKVLGIIEENEHVTAEALTDLENNKVNTDDLADVAFSGEYDDILNKPTLQMINENDLYYGVIGQANSNPGLNFNLQCNLDPLDPSTTIVTTVTDENLNNSLRPYFFNFKNDKLTFDYGQSNGSGYISAQEYSGSALGTEEKLTNAELLTDGAGMIGFYDEPNDESITVRDALINLQDAVDGIEIITAGTGLTKSGSTLNHTNSITANQNAVVKAFTFDSEGHIDSSADAAKYTIENIGTDIRFNDVFLRRCQKDYSTGSESGTNGNALTTQYVPVVTEATSRPNNDESNGEQLTPTTDPINNTDPVDAGGNSGGKAEMGDTRP